MMREFIKIVEGEELQLEQLDEAVGQQYMLATHDLATGKWDVKFFGDRAMAHEGWHQWAKVQGHKGDAYIGPVEITRHAGPKDRPQPDQPE